MFDFFLEETPQSPKKGNTVQEKMTKTEKMKRLFFRKTGTKKYKLTLSSAMKLNNMLSKTVAETSWILQVQNILNEKYLIDLTAYDYTLKECNNQGFAELYHVTRQFQKIYDEINVITSLDGRVLSVKNGEQLLEKWKNLKKETLQYFGKEISLEQFFAVNDEEFLKPDYLCKLISEVEFFFIYMQIGGYGQKFNPFGFVELNRDNAFKTAVIKWDLDFSGRYEIIPDSPLGKMEVKSTFEPNKNWLKQGYGEVPFLKIEELKPDFSLNGNYIFHNESGWLKEAELNVNEIVHPTLLYHKMNYKIQEIV